MNSESQETGRQNPGFWQFPLFHTRENTMKFNSVTVFHREPFTYTKDCRCHSNSLPPINQGNASY